MARIKFSKRQIAGVLLLSSTAIGATASGTASANAFTKFIGSKVSHAYNWVTDSTVGKVVGIIGIAAILLAVARVRNLWYEYNLTKFSSNKKKLLDAIEKLTSQINEELEDKNKKNLKENAVEKYNQTLNILKELKDKATSKENLVSSFNKLKQIFKEYPSYYNIDKKKLFSKIEEKYKIYTNLHDRLKNLLSYDIEYNKLKK